MQVLFSLSFLAFAVVASQTGAEDPLTEGTELVNMLLQETSKAMSNHEASTPCADYQGETAALQTVLTTRERALEAAQNQFATVKASITRKADRVKECDREIAAADEIIKTANIGRATMRETYATSKASWQARIDETKQVSDQIAAWQQHSIGGTKLSLLQSSLLQLGEQVSLPVKNILDAASITHLGKQTSDSSVRVSKRLASLSPSLIEKVDVATLMKELFAKIQKKLSTHMAKLKVDKATELKTIQKEMKAKYDARSEAEKKKTDLVQEKTNLASEITTLTASTDSLAQGAATALAARTTAKTELDANAAAIEACGKRFADDLEALRGEHNAVEAIKRQLTIWKDGGNSADSSENAGMGKSLKDVIAQVSVKPCKDFKGCAAGEYQVGECTSMASTVSCTACKQACDVGNYMVGTCDGSGKLDTIQCQSCGTCAKGEVLKYECSGETTSDSHTCEAHVNAKDCKVINGKAQMLAAGWKITGDKPDNSYYQPSNYCKEVDRTKAYCGFQFPGWGRWEYTTKNSGTAHITIGSTSSTNPKSKGGTPVILRKNGNIIAQAERLELNVQVVETYVAGDVFTLEEDSAVMVLQEFCLPSEMPPGSEPLIPDYSNCASSTNYNGDAIGHSHGQGALNSPQAWSAQNREKGQWWQMGLGSAKSVVGIQSQCRHDYPHTGQCITGFKAQSSSDGSSFSNVDNGKVFTQSADNKHDQITTSIFSAPVTAKYIRVVVEAWVGWASGRFAVVVP